jgi:threonine/homoserine/homoserine lactone efflux protein
MPSTATLALFLGAALIVAVLPGPGLFYIAGRALAGGRPDGFASCLGSTLGGFIHVVGGAVGVSALIMGSATAFTALKIVGGFYLIYLGIQTWRTAGVQALPVGASSATSKGSVIRQGMLVEATNPKTAAFFLALIPQFIDPAQGSVAAQFIILGSLSILLNTTMAILVVWLASGVRDHLASRLSLVRRLRQGSGFVLAGLGISLLMTRRPG